MTIEDELLRQMQRAIIAQIDKDIMTTLLHGDVNSNGRTVEINPKVDETAIDFTYDDAIDKFVYAFMNDAAYTKTEQNILYDFAQMMSEVLNIHKLCTVLPLHPTLKVPMLSEFKHMPNHRLAEWYQNAKPFNLLTYWNFDCNFDVLNFSLSNIPRNEYLSQIISNAVQQLHFILVEYLTKNTVPFSKQLEINFLDKYSTIPLSTYPPISPSVAQIHRTIDRQINDKGMRNSWILGSRMTGGLIEEYLGKDFIISELKSATELTGLCIEGGFSGVSTNYQIPSSNGFKYISHMGGLIEGKETLILGNGKVVDNESLAAGLELIPLKNNGLSVLGVRIRLILYKNHNFGDNYCSFPVVYKNL